DPKDQSEEAVQRRNGQAGRAFWVKARALRDFAFARALQDGKPLPDTPDTTTGETFRSLALIPDGQAFAEALRRLRRAAEVLPEDAAVQKEALRAELTLPARRLAPGWPFVERVCGNILALDEKDPRANYQLALFHFEQPQVDARDRSVAPTPAAKRSQK